MNNMSIGQINNMINFLYRELDRNVGGWIRSDVFDEEEIDYLLSEDLIDFKIGATTNFIRLNFLGVAYCFGAENLAELEKYL